MWKYDCCAGNSMWEWDGTMCECVVALRLLTCDDLNWGPEVKVSRERGVMIWLFIFTYSGATGLIAETMAKCFFISVISTWLGSLRYYNNIWRMWIDLKNFSSRVVFFAGHDFPLVNIIEDICRTSITPIYKLVNSFSHTSVLWLACFRNPYT